MSGKVSSSTWYSRLGISSYSPEHKKDRIAGNTKFVKIKGTWEYLHNPSPEYIAKRQALDVCKSQRKITVKDSKRNIAILISSIFVYLRKKHI